MINKATVIKAHQSNYPRPISFKRGDRLLVGKADSDYPGWVWVKLDGGNQGWAPKQYIKTTDNCSTALTDYTATELDINMGEELELVEQLNGWAWVKNQYQQCGWVPLNSIAIIECSEK